MIEQTWFRTIVPAGYAEATLTMEGASPILHKSSEFDPDGDLYRAFFMLGQKRSKSLDDGKRLRELEWKLSLYLDDQIGPYIPGKNVKELLRESATKWKKGEEIKRSLIVVDQRIPLLYDGPRDQDGLEAGKFYYDTMVRNAGPSGGRVWRRRPMFPGWALSIALAFDPEDLDFDQLVTIVERSKKYGLGDGRAIGFGSFEATLTAGAVHKGKARGSATKERSKLSEDLHAAARDRIMLGKPDELAPRRRTRKKKATT